MEGDTKVDKVFSKPWENSDVKVIVQGKTLYVHSMLLSFSSPVLKEMIEHSKEKEINFSNLQWLDVLNVFMMLYPQYESSMWSKSLTTLDAMLQVCSQLEIESATNRIEQNIMNKTDQLFLGIGEDDCGKILLLADKYSFAEALENCTSYISTKFQYYQGNLEALFEKFQYSQDTRNKILTVIARRHVEEIEKKFQKDHKANQTVCGSAFKLPEQLKNSFGNSFGVSTQIINKSTTPTDLNKLHSEVDFEMRFKDLYVILDYFSK